MNVNALAKHQPNPQRFVADELKRVRWKLEERKAFAKRIDLRLQNSTLPPVVETSTTVHHDLREVAQAKRRIAHMPANSLTAPIFVSISCY